MKRSSYYGRLNVMSLPSEIRNIWYSRNDDLPELPRFGWLWQQQADFELLAERELLIKFLEKTELTTREEQVIKLYVIEEYTYKEIGGIMNVGPSRINQILNKSLRRLRKNKESIIGIKEWESNSKKIKDYWDNEKNRLKNERLRNIYEYYYHRENTP